MRLASTILLGLFVVAVLPQAGCQKNQGDAQPPAEEERNPLKPRPEDPMAKNDLQRGTQKRLVESMMHNIGQLYTAYIAEWNRPPATVEEFKEYLKRDARNEYRALDAGTIIFLPKVAPSSNNLLAYEKDKYEKWNNRVVAFADGRVETLVEDQFQAALKGNGP